MTTPPVPHTPADGWVDAAPLLTQIRVAARMDRMDVPLADVEADAFFRQAAKRTHSPSDRLAFYLDAQLVHHPELLATDKDYPGWAEHIAALQTANRNARKETS